MANESRPHTLQHISRVRQLLDSFAIDLINRGTIHDASKFEAVEMGPLDEMQRLIDTEGPAARGTEEYSRRTAMLGPMLEHHYAHNPHHPEHYPNGISGMDLIDLVEMFCDWRAANLDRDAGSPMSLSYSIEKYKIDPMLESILRNTAERMGWAVS